MPQDVRVPGSGFGVHDFHGGVWSWTASQWGRDGGKPGMVVLRGGNGPFGELVGRCANERCGWLFVDRTRSHNRRWCSSAGCGNVERARRHYERHRRSAAEAS